MKAMVMEKISRYEPGWEPLKLMELPIPEPGPNEILIKVLSCGVCHTELDEIEGRAAPPKLPAVLGHQVVGVVRECGPGADNHKPGDRVGIGWIFSACGRCAHCMEGNDNLCTEFKASGCDANGGYAEYMVARKDYAFPIPDIFSPIQAAPLLCAGAIGYRSLRLTGLENGERLGLTGFGASAHLVLKMAAYRFPESEVYVFARSEKERKFALELGAAWAGDTDEIPPARLNAVIDTTPAWKPVVCALKFLNSGGRLVINAIRKEEGDKDYLLKLDYPTHLWMEKEIKSVANVAGRDIREFLSLAAEIPISPEVEEYSLEEANIALAQLKEKKIRGAKVLNIGF